MEKGDISNESPPRVLVVANDFLFTWPKGVINWGRGFGRWSRLADRCEFNPVVRMYLHDFSWRRHYRVDVVIIGVPEPFAERIQERLNRAGIAVANVYAVANVKDLVNSLAYSPDVQWVVHDVEEWGLAFGPRGARGILGLRTI